MKPLPDHRIVVDAIVARLGDELRVYVQAAEASRAEATHESSRAENKYDTRGLEASYLARGQSRQIQELEAAIAAFRDLKSQAVTTNEAVDVGALVEVESPHGTDLYFIGPRAGGTECAVAGREVLVITPQSPLGAQLMGRRAGDRLKLALPGNQAGFRIARLQNFPRLQSSKIA